MGEEGQDDGDHNAMLQLVSILYCRSVFKEFRRPVLAAYPNLAETYLGSVKEPIDLGTLLLRVIKRSTTIGGVRKGLQLVCSNALIFNAGYHTIEAITHHLFHTAEGLFEELLCQPFAVPPSSSSSAGFSDDFYKAKRWKRWQLVGRIPLNKYELDIFRSILKDFPHGDIPGYEPLLQSVEQRVTNHQASSSDRAFSLCDALLPIFEHCGRTSMAPSDPTATTPSCPLGFSHVPDENLELVEAIDDLLGVFLVLLEERYLRGNICSAFWAQPYHTLLWYPLEKDGAKRKPTWWPCVLIGDREMPANVVQCNLRRIPPPLALKLLKTRPKSACSAELAARIAATLASAAQSSATLAAEEADGSRQSHGEESVYTLLFEVLQECFEWMLVEFLGDHQLGWARRAACQALLSMDTTIFRGEKVCAQAVLAEAEEVRTWLSTFHSSHGANEEPDLPALPSVGELTRLTDTSEATAAYQKILRRRMLAEQKAAAALHHDNHHHHHSSRSNEKELSFEAVARFVSVSKLLPSDFGFSISSCIVPADETSPAGLAWIFHSSAVALPAAVRCSHVPPGMTSTKSLTYRRNALVRSHAFSVYLNRLKPLTLVDSTGQTQRQFNMALLPTAMEEVSLLATSQGKGKKKEGRGKSSGGSFPSGSPSPSPPLVTPTAAMSSISSTTSAATAVPRDLYIDPVLPTTRGKPLESGCSRYLAGEGLVYTRSVNFASPLFFRESVARERRKILLQWEVDHIAQAIQTLQEEGAVKGGSGGGAGLESGETHGHHAANGEHGQEKEIKRRRASSPPQPTASFSLSSRPTGSTAAASGGVSFSMAPLAAVAAKLPGKVGMIAKLQSRRNADRGAQGETKESRRASHPVGVSDMLPF